MFLKKVYVSLILGSMTACAIPSTDIDLDIPVPLWKQLNNLPILEEDYLMGPISYHYSSEWYEKDISFQKLPDGSLLLTVVTDTDNASQVSMFQQEQANQSFLDALKLGFALGTGNPAILGGSVAPPAVYSVPQAPKPTKTKKAPQRAPEASSEGTDEASTHEDSENG